MISDTDFYAHKIEKAANVWYTLVGAVFLYARISSIRAKRRMNIRRYTSADCAEMAELFYNTVHTVNARDYTEVQLNAWANGSIDLTAWDKSFSEHNTLVATEDGIIVGFGDMNGGYLDRLYVHRDHQRQGIATAIVSELEVQAAASGISVFTTHASITAKPFFEKRGYVTVRERKVIRSGVELTNYAMEKHLD